MIYEFFKQRNDHLAIKILALNLPQLPIQEK